MLLTCPTCKSELAIPDGTHARVRCPACKTVFDQEDEPDPAPPEAASPPRRRARPRKWSTRITTLWVVAVLYVAACVLPAVGGESGPGVRGVECLALGPWVLEGGMKDLLGWFFLFAWTANLVVFFGWVTLAARGRAAPAVAGWGALALAIPLVLTMPQTLLVGGYVWLTSMAALAFGSTIRVLGAEDPIAYQPSRWR